MLMTAAVLASSDSSSVSCSSKMMSSSRESFQATAYSEDNTITAREVNIISDDVENEVDRPHILNHHHTFSCRYSRFL